MKMNDFYGKNNKKGSNRPKNPQVFTLNNDERESQLTLKITDLEAKVAILEGIRAEKDHIEGQLTHQRELSGKHSDIILQLDKQVADFTAEQLDKQRILGTLDTLQQSNNALSQENGEAVATLSLLRGELTTQRVELEKLRTNNANLDNSNRAMVYETGNKDRLMQELTRALEDLKEQHEGLSNSSNAVATQYAEVSHAREKLDGENIKLNGEVLLLRKQQELTMEDTKKTINKREKAIEQRVRGQNTQQIEDLTQNINALTRINNYYKTELSKPQHLSIGAIARQEGFKIPLASSAINYRKNNLGTGKPTLLRFGGKESS